MKVVIMGCGRVGGRLATILDAGGHKVVIIDVDSYSFRWLPSAFKGTALVGNGLDEQTMIKAGIENADVFVSTTEGDNRNVMAAQIAKHIYNVPRVVSRIYDPIREEMYSKLGIETISPTKVGAELLQKVIEE
ncbi:MAG: TrkA family potassium uptake protein [Anaerolineales bacterium]|nr:TrkA family potassium uptake protein [Anaerolineales bacterium]